jgi:hypothetical protein
VMLRILSGGSVLSIQLIESMLGLSRQTMARTRCVQNRWAESVCPHWRIAGYS